jgi:restriction endonuclease S subunit
MRTNCRNFRLRTDTHENAPKRSFYSSTIRQTILVLLSEDGFNLVNRTSRIAFKVEGKVWVNNHAHVLRPKNGTNIDFLAEYLESISLEPFITGTYQRKLNKSECERIPIPLPPPDIQNEIASTIDRIVRSLAAIDSHVSASRNLISSLLTNFSEN